MEWKDHPADPSGSIYLQLLFESLGPNQSKLTIVNGGFPDGMSSDVWIDGAKEAWDGQAVQLKDFLKKNPDITKFFKKS